MTLVLIDVSSLIYRAHHTLSPDRFKRPSDGLANNVVYGVASMTINILKNLQRDHEAIFPIACMDSNTCSQSRIDIDAEYKKQRPSCPVTMQHQFQWVRDLYNSMQIPCIEVPKYEADDIIATLATRTTLDKVVIISPDKDFNQLVNEKVTIYDSKKKVYIDSEAVFEKHGVKPEHFVLYQSILGDKVDNIPGITGIGPKRAALIVDAIVKNNVSPAFEKVLSENSKQIANNKKLVKLKNDLNIQSKPKEFHFHQLSNSSYITFLDTMEISSVTLTKYSKVSSKSIASKK